MVAAGLVGVGDPRQPVVRHHVVPGIVVTAGTATRHVRPASRVLVLDPSGACLLAHVTTDREAWLFTPGGGIEDGEDGIAAARRELAEETSLHVGALTGPVLYRRAHFRFMGRPIEARETFWVAGLDHRPAVVSGQLDEYEQDLLGTWRWLTAAQLRATATIFYPRCLPDLLDELAGAHRPDPQRPSRDDGGAAGPATPDTVAWVEVETADGWHVEQGAQPPRWAVS